MEIIQWKEKPRATQMQTVLEKPSTVGHMGNKPWMEDAMILEMEMGVHANFPVMSINKNVISKLALSE